MQVPYIAAPVITSNAKTMGDGSRQFWITPQLIDMSVADNAGSYSGRISSRNPHPMILDVNDMTHTNEIMEIARNSRQTPTIPQNTVMGASRMKYGTDVAKV